MAEMVVSALVTEVVGRLTSVAIQGSGVFWGFKNDVSALKKDFEEIQAVLQDAENKRIKEKAIDLWLKRLRSASLEVENVVDEISTEAMLQNLYKKRGIKCRVRAFFSANHNQLMFSVKLAHRVKALRRKVDALASRRFELKLTNSASKCNANNAGVEGEMPDRETSSLIRSSLIFGRNEEMEMVVQRICNRDLGKYEDDDTIRVYGIWGMGGLGKTTLAQLVYNHHRVKQYFQLQCWIYVSEKFQVIEIIRKVIKQIDKCECELRELEILQESLQNKLRGTRFLIVLDDVWIEDAQKAEWDKLSDTLSCGEEGSIVVMTTRSKKTSQMMAKVPELQHKLGYLSEDNSWLLFEKLAFARGREGDGKTQLEPIGREIVKKCEGLPLAVKTLGSLMWTKRSISDWERVKESKIWELQENDILPALKLSYDNLLPHLRRCFAYCCLFPKGYEMKMDKVIQLWVSNGFIPPRGETSLYLLGEEIFNCLVWRSFFQGFKVNKYFDSYKMHDLMHDMAQYVMKDDIFVAEPMKEVIIRDEVLHLSSSHPDFLFSPSDVGKSLRSILLFKEMDENHIHQIVNHVNLRVLYLSGIRLRTLHESICKLKHLKYLNLSNSSIQVLPDSIVYLQNLQVLLLNSCLYLSKLPEGLKYMSNLQCLDLINCYSLRHLPLGIKELTNLRILPEFPVGNNTGAKIGELGDHNNLEGTLAITRLGNVGFGEARSANLVSKRKLLVLKLRWKGNFEGGAYEKNVLEGLEPNPCLKRLEIEYYMGRTISPSWMLKLQNLAEIEFFGCNNCERLPLLAGLPNLRLIKLSTMSSLKCIHDDDVGNTSMFLCLQELVIDNCPSLVSLPSNLPKLEVLRLQNCKNLVSLPEGIQSFKNLNELVIVECKHLNRRYEEEIGVDWPKISHIPCISIDSVRARVRTG